MTIGTISRWLSVLFLLAALPLHAATFTLDTLMAELRPHGPVRAAFVETKQLAVLNATQEVRGELEFRPSGYLRRTHTWPRKEIYEVDGDAVTITRPDQAPTRVTLADYPPLAAVVESQRAILGGDLDALKRLYTLDLRGDAARWQLTLTPRSGPISQYVQRIDLYGERGRLRRIETLETSGDKTTLELRPLDAK